MKRVLGWVLLLVGIGVVCLGIYLALAPVVSMYQTAMDDPMKDTPVAPGSPEGEDGKVVAAQMFKGLIVGVLGLPLTIAGTVLLGVSFIQRMRKRLEQKRG